MRVGSCLAALWLFALGATGQAGEFQLNGQTFTLADGFTIESVAGLDLVQRPISADFDDQGRLYVSESSGSNDNVQQQLAERPHRILCLEDADGDGRFDRRTVFADKMMFPEGVMWRNGSLYVAAPPSIWKLTDTDGDGVVDQRQEWFQGKTLTGCANDLHGPYRGPDGWIYWCKGAFAEQTYQRPGRKPLVTKAAHIFRCPADGGGMEPVMTGGMDNPVDVVFAASGERFFSATFLQHPAGGKRDGLIHAIYGGVYGKPWNVIDNHPQTGELLPVLSHLGAAAPCGLACYESRAFGDAYQGNLFAALFNMHKVTRHILAPVGSSYQAKDEDFLVSDNLDFHPTDVLEDADGSLLVIDTGGWYKLCCPTSQLHKPDVPGAIYRVRRAGAAKIIDPRGLQIDWKAGPEELAILLGDERPAVCWRAIEEISQRGEAALSVLAGIVKRDTFELRRQNAVWALGRIESPAARALVRLALGDSNETTCLAAMHLVSLHKDSSAVTQLLPLLSPEKPARVRRLAAEALGRIGDTVAVAPLLAAAEKPADRGLEHAIAHALIEIQDREGTVHGLASASIGTRRVALIALGEMEGGRLMAETVAPLLTAADPALRETAAWVIGRHPEWGDDLAGFFRQRLAAPELPASEQLEMENQLAHFAQAEEVRKLLATAIADQALSACSRATALRAMARSGVSEAPPTWGKALVDVLASPATGLTPQVVVTCRALPWGKQRPDGLAGALLKIASDEKQPAELRLEALAATPGGIGALDTPLFDFLLSQLRVDGEVGHRSAAVDVLSAATLNHQQLTALMKVFGDVGPLEVGRLLAGFEKYDSAEIGLPLVAALKKSSALASLRPDQLQRTLAKYPPAVQQAAEEIYAQLNQDALQQKKQLESLLAALQGGDIKPGDIRRGQAIFHGKKTACFACHAMGYLGGNIGPDLTRIGGIRAERDLLESILFPSASFVRSYEPVVVRTSDGQIHSGVVRVDSPQELVLAIAADKLARIPKAEIEDVSPGKVSIMPAGLDKQLSTQDLADLLAYLKAAK